MKLSESESRLTSALSEWQVSPAREPGFRAGVWARLQRHRGGLSWPGYVRAHAAWVAAGFAVALLAGAWTGREQAKTKAAVERAAIASRYVQALDARTMRMP